MSSSELAARCAAWTSKAAPLPSKSGLSLYNPGSRLRSGDAALGCSADNALPVEFDWLLTIDGALLHTQVLLCSAAALDGFAVLADAGQVFLRDSA